MPVPCTPWWVTAHSSRPPQPAPTSRNRWPGSSCSLRHTSSSLACWACARVMGVPAGCTCRGSPFGWPGLSPPGPAKSAQEYTRNGPSHKPKKTSQTSWWKRTRSASRSGRCKQRDRSRDSQLGQLEIDALGQGVHGRSSPGIPCASVHREARLAQVAAGPSARPGTCCPGRADGISPSRRPRSGLVHTRPPSAGHAAPAATCRPQPPRCAPPVRACSGTGPSVRPGRGSRSPGCRPSPARLRPAW